MSGVAEFYRPSRQKSAIREQGSAVGFTGAAPSLSSRQDLLIIAGFVLSIAILTALGGLSFRYMAAEAEADRSFNHTQVVIGDLDRLVSSMKDVETGQRGFVITGDEKFLGPYKAALGDVKSRMAELKRLTVDNPRQQRGGSLKLPPSSAISWTALQETRSSCGKPWDSRQPAM